MNTGHSEEYFTEDRDLIRNRANAAHYDWGDGCDGWRLTPKHIRPIAICLFRNGDKILVSDDGIDPSTGGAYCRPLGGSAEFGELAANALVREIREELGVEETT